MINRVITSCSKLAQKVYKTRHDWLGKVNNWELCKKLIFDYTTVWYMNKLGSILENVITWDTKKSPNPNQKIRPGDNW